MRQSLFEALPPKLTLPGHAGGTYFAKFTPDGRRVITGGADNVARVWESDSGRMSLELLGHADGVTGADDSVRWKAHLHEQPVRPDRSGVGRR